MKTVEYDNMAKFEDTYWWHVGRKSIVSLQLRALNLPEGARVLNIGCGTGGMIPFMEEYGRVSNVDTSEEAIRYCKLRGYEDAVKVDGIELPFGNEVFDVVVATDVLEHIKDEQAALAEWRRVLKPGGHLLITVPAYQWLWSSHDESLHHFRRYTASEVHRKLNQKDFDIKRRSYVIVFSFPLVVGFRLLRGLASKEQKTSYVSLPAWLNSLFINLLRIEARAVKVISFPFGTSVLAVARKN